MRQTLFIGALLLGGLAVPGFLVTQPLSAGTTGSVSISLKSGRGLAVIQSRGALLGRIRAGRVVATPNVVVRCWKYKRRLASGMIRYRRVREGCTDVTFHVFSDDGTWRVRSKGRGINVSGVARGSLTLDGASRGRTGTYSIAGGEFRPWPRERHTYSLAR